MLDILSFEAASATPPKSDQSLTPSKVSQPLIKKRKFSAEEEEVIKEYFKTHLALFN